jgi:hypothetical protein
MNVCATTSGFMRDIVPHVPVLRGTMSIDDEIGHIALCRFFESID